MSPRPLGILAADPLSTAMAGPARRSLALARELATVAPIELWYEGDPPPEMPGVVAHSMQVTALLERAAGYQALLIPAQYALKEQTVFDAPCIRIIDCTAPFPLETAALLADASPEMQRDITHLQAWAITRAVSAGDYWLASNEAQEAWLIGLLTALGRLTPTMATTWDSHPRMLWAPYGIDTPSAEPPDPSPKHKLLEALGMPSDGPYLLWTGGLWPWLDPATVVEAMRWLAADHPTLHLLIPGAHSPHATSPEAAQVEALRQLLTDPSLRNRVHLIDWIPGADWPAIAAGAALHVSAHVPSPESLCSYRTRYLEAVKWRRGLVTTMGDRLGEQLEAHGIAATVFPGHPEAFAAAVDSLLADADLARNAPWEELQQFHSWSIALSSLTGAIAEGLAPFPDGPWEPQLAGHPAEAPPAVSLLTRILNKLRR